MSPFSPSDPAHTHHFCSSNTAAAAAVRQLLLLLLLLLGCVTPLQVPVPCQWPQQGELLPQLLTKQR
jgi:hypothetical protein